MTPVLFLGVAVCLLSASIIAGHVIAAFIVAGQSEQLRGPRMQDGTREGDADVSRRFSVGRQVNNLTHEHGGTR